MVPVNASSATPPTWIPRFMNKQGNMYQSQSILLTPREIKQGRQRCMVVKGTPMQCGYSQSCMREWSVLEGMCEATLPEGLVLT
ncbi:hypothetical protein E2C01_063270 [Portunus trituberculatus]|uniref:Uncharacterized protein n=1 Tax=Portunus trituberculatus TaxID=210409 RepID=A0A5B7HII4_PORTR|nr:hypothetical protein [Portunus trituberculatus]